MGRKTKLYKKMIPVIVEMVKLRMPWTHIAMALGVSDRTLLNWRQQGISDRENGKWTNCRYLVDAIEEARAELIKKYAENVRNEALNGKVTETEREIEHKDGSIVTERVTKTEPPNATLALKILGMELPEMWGEQHNVNVNWEDSLLSQDHDPEKNQSDDQGVCESRPDLEVWTNLNLTRTLKMAQPIQTIPADVNAFMTDLFQQTGIELSLQEKRCTLFRSRTWKSAQPMNLSGNRSTNYSV